MVTYRDEYPKTFLKSVDYSKEIWRFCPWRLVGHIYTGCAHACTYCYVKHIVPGPSNEVGIRRNLLEIIKGQLKRLRKKTPVNLASITDPYQPVEEKTRSTKRIIEILSQFEFPFLIVTKSDLVLRDVEILAPMAKKGLVYVQFTITTLREDIQKKIEPGAPSFEKRLEAMRQLHEAGVPVALRLDPLIPYINDDPSDIEEVIKVAAQRGARSVMTSTIELPSGVWRDFRNILKSINSALPFRYVEMFFSKGRRDLRGYPRVKRGYAYEKLSMIREICDRHGVRFATCKEGFFDLHTLDQCCCDGFDRGVVYLYPTIYDYWSYLKRRGGPVSCEELIENLQAFELSKSYTDRIRKFWNEGKLFEGVDTARMVKRDGKIHYQYSPEGADLQKLLF